MTVSMLALLRLFLYSFLFGVSFGLFYALFRFASSLLCTRNIPLSDGRIATLPERVRGVIREKRKSSVIKGASFFISFLGELVFCLFAASSLSVFYYFFNDGIPRLFSLLAVFLGFFLFQKTARRLLWQLLDRLYIGVYLVFLFALAYFFKPLLLFVLLLLRGVWGRLVSLLKRVYSFFLLFLLPLRMKRYIKKELSRLSSLEEVSD